MNVSEDVYKGTSPVFAVNKQSMLAMIDTQMPACSPLVLLLKGWNDEDHQLRLLDFISGFGISING